jgi:hypothetical protein
MDRLEEELKQALARMAPREGFAERVAARAAAEKRVVAFPIPRWAMAAAATVLLGVGGGLAYREHQGEVAKEQVMQAMRITAVKLNRIQAHVREVRQ